MKLLGILAAGIALISIPALASDLHIVDQTSGIQTNFINNNQTSITINIGKVNTIARDDGYEIELPEEFTIGKGYISGPNNILLPTYSSLFAVPEDAALSVSVEYSDYIDFEDFTLAQALNEDQKWMKTIIQASEGFYPTELVKFEHAGTLRDIHLARLVISPVQYDQSTKTLRVYHDLTVSTDYGEGEVLPANSTVSEAFLPVYRALLTNVDLVDNVQQRRGAYWIIVPSSLAASIETYEQWIKAQGYHTRVILTSEIGSNPTFTSIRNFILQEFNAAELKPDYICLIGDVSTSLGVDTRTYGNPYGFGYLDSDNYYSFLLGDDYFPDVFVGRISVSSSADMSYYLNKYYLYGRTPYMDDTGWYLNATMVAGGVSNWFYSQRRTKLWVREMMQKHHYTEVDTFFSTYYHEPTPAEINASINGGVSFVNYRGYGATDGWTSPYYYTGNVAQLSNGPRYGIMTSIVCGTGDYNDYSDCLGEAWIKYSNKGGPGFIGTSNHDSHTKWNNAIDCGIYWGLFEEDVFGLAQCELMGKMNMYNAFPEETHPGGRVESYFNSYNDLGDPALMMWNGIPLTMNVTHTDSIPLGGTGFVAYVTDGGGNPIQNAYVCIWKGDEIFDGKFTDNNGHAGFQVDYSSAGDMAVTVTKATYIPYEGEVVVFNTAVSVGANSFTLDDDNQGNSNGNGDHAANPYETIELTTMLKNFGSSQTAVNVVAELVSDDPHVQVISSTVNFGNIAPGDSSSGEGAFVIQVSATAMDNLQAEIDLHISDDGGDDWHNFIFMPIVAVNCEVIGTQISQDGNSNGILDRGETGNLVLEVLNNGSINGNGISGVLRTDDSLVAITDSMGTFGDIAVDSSKVNLTNYFTVSTLMDIYDGHDIDFVLELTCASGQVMDVPFSLQVGTFSSTDPIGPDSYGYYCFDNSDEDYLYAPEFNWIPIETSWDYVSIEDDEIHTRTLPFEVRYYGNVFNSFSICDNGYITFGSSWWGNFLNTNIPSPQCAPGMVAPFWDDLSSNGNENPPPYTVRYHHDASNGRLIVGWDNARSNDTYGYQDFEIIVLDTALWPTRTGDNEIIFQYNDLNGIQSSSIGIVSPDRADGIQYLFNYSYTPGAASLIEGRAIKFTTGSSYMTDIEDNHDETLPLEVSLHQNYPNPFNPNTSIKYDLVEAADVSLEIFDVLGRKVATLVDTYQQPGHYTVTWNANDSGSEKVAAGVYFYKLDTSGKQFVKKMILLK